MALVCKTLTKSSNSLLHENDLFFRANSHFLTKAAIGWDAGVAKDEGLVETWEGSSKRRQIAKPSYHLLKVMTQSEYRVSIQLSAVSHQLKGDREPPQSRSRIEQICQHF
ncbi:MAG: hypothetical protein SW833_23045 [Cyanobacteriota bacterium]|nr:hypothetical protein [Cyanobacteriota bacterium]